MIYGLRPFISASIHLVCLEKLSEKSHEVLAG
jgi:hypothetical protein